MRRDLNDVKERTIKVSVERVLCSEGASWSGGCILVRGSVLVIGSVLVRRNITEKALDLGSAWCL